MYGKNYYGKNPYTLDSRKDIITLYYWLAVLLGLIYNVAYIYFLIEVLFKVDFLYGVYRPELIPGPFVDDRYNWVWVFLVINNLRIFIPLALLWTFQSVIFQYKRDDVIEALRYVILMDLILLMMFFVMLCFFCNNGIFRNAACDANLQDYCEAFWRTQPEVCTPSQTTVGQCDLEPNPCFFNWVYVTLVFTLLDIVLVRFLEKTNTVVRNDFIPYLYDRSMSDVGMGDDMLDSDFMSFEDEDGYYDDDLDDFGLDDDDDDDIGLDDYDDIDESFTDDEFSNDVDLDDNTK